MSRTADIDVALHFDSMKGVVVSTDGNGTKGTFIVRRLIASIHQTGRTTKGTDRYGNDVTLPMAHLQIPEWLAIKEGLV